MNEITKFSKKIMKIVLVLVIIDAIFFNVFMFSENYELAFLCVGSAMEVGIEAIAIILFESKVEDAN